MKDRKPRESSSPEKSAPQPVAEMLCLATFAKGTEIEDAVGRVAGKYGSPPLEEVLVAFDDLRGALYHPRTRAREYYEDNPEELRPGRVSSYYSPVFMRKNAVVEYLELCTEQGSLPVVLAHEDSVAVRREPTDRGVSAPEFTGLGELLEELAGQTGRRLTRAAIR